MLPVNDVSAFQAEPIIPYFSSVDKKHLNPQLLSCGLKLVEQQFDTVISKALLTAWLQSLFTTVRWQPPYLYTLLQKSLEPTLISLYWEKGVVIY